MKLLNYIFLLVIIFQSNVGFSQRSLDLYLQQIQNNKFDSTAAKKAINLPYDEIINNLNKCLFIYNYAYDNHILDKQTQQNAELIEKLSLVNYLKGNQDVAFNFHKLSIDLFNKIGDLRQKANAMNSLAYQSKNRDLNSSIELMREAIDILKSNKFTNDLATAYDNLGVLFEIKNELDSAMFYYQNALSLKNLAKDSIAIPYSLNNIAGVLFAKRKYEQGLNNINLSNAIRKAKGDFLGIAHNEFMLGVMFTDQNDFNNAEIHFRRSLGISKQKSYPDLIAKNSKYLAQILFDQKRSDSAYIYFNIFYELNDSIYNAQKQSQLLEMEVLYGSEKKSFQIKSLNDENRLNEIELEKKRNTLYFLILILMLFGIGTFIIIKAYIQKNKANKIISLQKQEVEEQKQKVEEHQKEILDSIHYAKRIQNAILPTEKYIESSINTLKK